MRRALLRRLSVLGDSFDVPLAAAVAGVPAAELVGELDAAQRAGLLTVYGSSIRFVLTARATLMGELGVRGLAEAHRSAADALQRVRPQDLVGIAVQRAGAIAVLGLDAVLEAVEAAATAAVRAHDWDAVAAIVQHGIAAAAAEHDRRTDELRLQRARALYRAGRFDEAMVECRTVAQSARVSNDHCSLAEAAIVVRALGDRAICAELLSLCREALSRIGGGDEAALRSLLLSQQAMLEANLERVAARRDDVAEAMRLAEASADPRALAQALHASQMAAPSAREVKQRLAIADRLERVAEQAGLDEYLGWPLVWRVDALFQLGDRPALDSAIARLEEHGRKHADALAAWKAKMAMAVVAQLEGRFADAERIGADAVEMARRGGHESAQFIYRILVSHCRGMTKAGTSSDFRVPDFPQGSEAMAAFPAMEAALRGELETTRALFDRALPFRSTTVGGDLEVPTHAALAICAWELGRADVAPELRAELLPFAEELAVSTGGQAASLGSVSRYIAQMAALMGEWEAMEEDFTRALRRSMEVGDRPAIAETHLDWARALLLRGHAKDRERVDALLDSAARDAGKLGMEPLLRRVESLRQELEARPRHPLTARELEVAGLVAEGCSNKEIAGRLRLSVRTAENHLLNIMNKLGLQNRAQVAAWVTRTQTTAARGPMR